MLDGNPVRMLAVSFMLPPMLYPQAIQIGRLLEGSGVDLVTVSGRFSNVSEGSNSMGPQVLKNLQHRLEFPHQAPLSGLAHRIAMRVAPFYGRSPDEFVRWSRHTAIHTCEWLNAQGREIDVLATFGEPMSDHLVGLQIKKKFGLPWLAHFSDPWVDNPFRKFQPLANLCNRKLEAQVIAAADSLVFTSEETRQMVMSKYPEAWKSKALVLPHSFRAGDFAGNQRVSDAGDIVLRYLGNFYGHRTPFPLISSLERLAKTYPELLRGVRVELVGGLSGWMRWHPAIKRLPPGLLVFRGSVPYRNSLELMSDADLLLVIDAPAKTSVFLPSKLVDYVGAARPILGIVPPGASDKLIRRLGGLTADPSSPMDIDAALSSSIRNIREMRESNAPWGDAAVRAEFEIQRVATSFRSMLDTTMQKARNG